MPPLAALVEVLVEALVEVLVEALVEAIAPPVALPELPLPGPDEAAPPAPLVAVVDVDEGLPVAVLVPSLPHPEKNAATARKEK